MDRSKVLSLNYLINRKSCHIWEFWHPQSDGYRSIKCCRLIQEGMKGNSIYTHPDTHSTTSLTSRPDSFRNFRHIFRNPLITILQLFLKSNEAKITMSLCLYGNIGLWPGQFLVHTDGSISNPEIVWFIVARMLYSRHLKWKGMNGISISYSKIQTILRIEMTIVITIGLIDQWWILDFLDGWGEGNSTYYSVIFAKLCMKKTETLGPCLGVSLCPLNPPTFWQKYVPFTSFLFFGLFAIQIISTPMGINFKSIEIQQV